MNTGEIEKGPEPGHLTREQLEGFGVKSLNRYDLFLQCLRCDTVWSPPARTAGDPRPAYWRCPNRCNW